MDGISNSGVIGVTDPIYPGQHKVEPGVLVIGQPGDFKKGQRPAWAKNGSFLVYVLSLYYTSLISEDLFSYRQLDQLVPEYWKFINDITVKFVPPGSVPTPEQLHLIAARTFGRWMSGPFIFFCLSHKT